jgi:Zn-dependent peptidase ImmA (M78 family)
MAKLAKKASISPTTLSLYENGKRLPREETLRRLASAVDYPVSFMTAPDVEMLPLGGASFRCLSTLTAQRRDQALAAGALAVELSRWIEQRFRLPAPDIPQLPGQDPEMAANSVREAWGIGVRPIPNMIHLLEAHGVRVFSLFEECHDVDAFSVRIEGVPFVFLNTMKTAERSRMDAAHELGHLVMHSDGDIPRGPGIEDQARKFASAFLMPRSDVLQCAPRFGRPDDLIQAKKRWGVAISALAYRMHSLGLLTEWQARHIYKNYRSSEPDPAVRESSQALEKVFRALFAEGMPKNRVARDLRFPMDELSKLVFGLLPAPTSEATADGRPRLRVVTEDFDPGA